MSYAARCVPATQAPDWLLWQHAETIQPGLRACDSSALPEPAARELLTVGLAPRRLNAGESESALAARWHSIHIDECCSPDSERRTPSFTDVLESHLAARALSDSPTF